jgi:hypothetical protein
MYTAHPSGKLQLISPLWETTAYFIFFFSSTHNDKCILSYDNSTAMYKFPKNLHPAGFELGIFCSAGGRDDHFTTPPGRNVTVFNKSRILV